MYMRTPGLRVAFNQVVVELNEFKVMENLLTYIALLERLALSVFDLIST